MSAIHWMPFYVADYISDTMHLSQGQHGAYLLLICHYWQRGPIPLKQCLSIAKAMNEQEQSNVRDVLEMFFELDGDHYRHARIESERILAEQRHEKRVLAGKRGGEARAEKASNASSNAKAKPVAMLKQPQPQPHIDTSNDVSNKNKGAGEAMPLAMLEQIGIDHQTWLAFSAMRKKIRKPMTHDAELLIAKKLQGFHAKGYSATAILEESIANSWQGVFEPKTPPLSNHTGLKDRKFGHATPEEDLPWMQSPPSA